MTKGHNILTSIVKRIENLNEEKKAIGEDINVAFAEAKVHGFNVKYLREVLRLRKMKKDDLEERNRLVAEYGAALGFDLL